MEPANSLEPCSEVSISGPLLLKPLDCANVAPDSLRELMRWPRTNLQATSQSIFPLIRNVAEWLSRGIGLITSYSGIGCPELASIILQRGVTEMEHGIHSDAEAGRPGPSDPGFIMIESCEHKKTVQTVLLQHDLHGPAHLFEDINSQVPPGVAAVLDRIEAQKSMSPKQKVEAFVAMKKVLFEVESTGRLFRKGRSRYCLRHRCLCQLADIPQDVAQHGVVIHIAGLTCVDFSKRKIGAKGMRGPSGCAFLCWAFQRRAVGESIIIIENVPSFDTECLMSILGSIYHLKAQFVLGPEALGWWVSRPRKFLILVHKQAQLVSEMDPSTLQSLFLRKRPLSGPRGDMFFAAPTKYINAEKARRLGKKGVMMLTESEIEKVNW